MSSSLTTRILTAVVALPILICAILFLPQMNHLAFAIIVILCNAVGTWELHNNILKKKIDVPFTGYLGILLPVIELINLNYIHIDGLIAFVLSAFLGFAFFVEVIHGAIDNFKGSIERIAATCLTLCYPSLFMVYAVKLCFLHSGPNAILVFLGIVFGSDSMAYFSGMLFGKNNKGVVKCSPNKSIAGFIGGTIGISLLMAILVAIFPGMLNVTPLKMFLIALPTSVFGTCGDLFESMLKRSAGVKDAGIVIPGRGGMLDCIDSLSIAIPLFSMFFEILV
ncbi:MAG: phosphatidate cytidylyltransferase [Candidatus Ornithospirochaeta sp.]